MLDPILKEIAAPSVDQCGAPFFALNAKLEPEEMRREMNVFHEMGMGGCFLHSRVGLASPYMEKEYMDALRAAIEECKKLGLRPWLYDEDRWPSGAAGGIVTKDRRYRVRSLFFTEAGEQTENKLKDTDPEDLLNIACFAVKLDGNEMISYRMIEENETVAADEKKFRAYRLIEQAGNPWFNGQTYLDTMNPDAVAEFIRVTHEAFKHEFGEYFGNVIPGIFTDEPTYSRANFHHESCMPWTDRLPEAYEARSGKSIIPDLPLLFYRMKGELFSKVRLNYFDTAADLFHHSFMKQIGDWCQENNLEFTGHLLCEDSVNSQIYTCGSAMRGYEYEQAPGIDLLTEHWNIFDTAKQCTSVAHQFDKKRRLSETYGCTGWDFPFFGHKALGDWQYALGINFRCQHLSWYSMKGEAKRDYPACIFDQSPWYKNHHYLEEYFSRLGTALQHGEEQRSILVIHPIESSWGIFCAKCSPEENDVKNMREIRTQLLKANLDFDYGEEEMMSRYAQAEGNLLRMAKAFYKTVVIPQLRTIRKTTLDLLQAFAQAGGNVFYTGSAPEYLDGEKSTLPGQVFASAFQQVTYEDLAEKVSAVDRLLSITDDTNGKEIWPVLSIMKKEDDQRVLFICNTGVEYDNNDFGGDFVRNRKLTFPAATVKVFSVPENADVIELDLLTGKSAKVSAAREGDAIVFKTSFDELQSRLFLIGKTSEEIAEVEEKQTETVSSIALSEDWKITPDELNVLPLDMAKYSINGSEFSKPEYILLIDGYVREALGEPWRGGHMVQPWLMEKMDQSEKSKGDLVLEYEFFCDAVPQSDCFLGVEDANLYQIKLNGNELDAKDEGFWCDRSLRLRKVPCSFLKEGKNILTLQIRYHAKLAGLETIYLLGDFSTADGRITGEKMLDTAKTEDLTKCGFTYYSGNMTYGTDVEIVPENGKEYHLQLAEWRGVGMTVSCNDGPEIFLSWAPFSADLTPYLKNGKNHISIKLLGSRRNSHGPFYDKVDTPSWCGSGAFYAYEHPERYLVPFGLLGQPKIVVKA